MRVAVIQTQSFGAVADNCRRVQTLISQAAEGGAALVALPEYCCCLGPPAEIVPQAGAIYDLLVPTFSRLARELGLHLLLGSVPEPAPEPGKIYNTSLLFGPDGREVTRYRKIHLFDIHIPGKVSFQESAHVLPGRETVAVPLPALGWTVGLSICYDLRFPELFRGLVDLGAELIMVPAAFSQVTGRDHWEVLLRARAIENQVYLLAPAQAPHPDQSIRTYGRSMIIDPWGLVRARAGDGEEIIFADLDQGLLHRIRTELPCLHNRRL